MKKILFPTDFSIKAENAFLYALQIAKKFGASITTIHTYNIPVLTSDASIGTSMYESMAEGREEFEFSEYKAFTKKMHEIAENEELTDVEVNHILEQGFAVDEILEFSKTENADLIVMGTSGARGLKEVLWGSNSGTIVENAKCNVLVVPEVAAYKDIKKIAYATNLEKIEEDAIFDILEYVSLFDAELHIVHVSYLDEAWNKAKLKQFQDMSWLENRLKDVHFDIVEGDNVVKSLEEYAEENDIDLLAMFTQKRSLIEKLFVKSYTKTLAYHTEVPLLIFHKKEDKS